VKIRGELLHIFYELNSYAVVSASFDRRDIFLEAVFLWITPFFAALSISDWAVLSFFKVISPESSFKDSRNSLVTFLTLVLVDLFRIRLISFCIARFNADL
jgi:hypothetical protein